MSYFYPIADSKVSMSAASAGGSIASGSSEFLTLDESTTPFFRSFDNSSAAPTIDTNSAAFFESSAAPVVFRSVGSSLSIPSFGAPLTRSTQPDSGSGGDDDDSAAANDSTSSDWGVSAIAGSASSADTIRSALKSLSLSSAVAAAIDVEEAPAFIERHSSFLSHTVPTDILLALATVLESQSIDFQYTPNKHKIRGVVMAESVSATFVIRVWRRSSESAFLVEFQRRSGCVVTFTNFYRACAQSLSHLIVGGANGSGSRTTSPVPFEVTLNSSQPKSGSVTLDAPTLTALTEMAASADTVCASEAMRVLSRAVASSAANQQFVLTNASASNSAVAALTATIASPNAYLQLLACKLAVALFTVVAVTAPLRAAIIKLLPAASVTAVATSDLIARETLRVLRTVSAAPSSALRMDKLVLPAVVSSDKLSLAAGAGFTPVSLDAVSDSASQQFIF